VRPGPHDAATIGEGVAVGCGDGAASSGGGITGNLAGGATSGGRIGVVWGRFEG
jgi:hypothetical protein